uniref:Uncharacterized protein n=1 Tax=uncultured prokaryote TaxID=198431 RepID=A0A0H5QHU9_9ZZZZ|nr:hypothetical protein [uncultured prokaryote]
MRSRAEARHLAARYAALTGRAGLASRCRVSACGGTLGAPVATRATTARCAGRERAWQGGVALGGAPEPLGWLRIASDEAGCTSSYPTQPDSAQRPILGLLGAWPGQGPPGATRSRRRAWRGRAQRTLEADRHRPAWMRGNDRPGAQLASTGSGHCLWLPALDCRE